MFLKNYNLRKLIIYSILVFWAAGLLIFKLLVRNEIMAESEMLENIWWMGLLLFGAMLAGFVNDPLVKSSFPKGNDQRIIANPRLHLKDHEVLMGYYWVAAIVVFLGSFIFSPLLYGEQTIFQIKSVYFWWAVAGTGILNVLIFYFYNKALRYGDLSLVSATRGFTPVITLPISFAIFSLLKDKAPLSNPHVTLLGFIGIMLIVGDLIINSFQSRTNKKEDGIIPKGTDWFAHHPVLSGLLAASIAGLSINFDKVSVDAANPFLLGVIMPIVVFVITSFWILATDGQKRIAFIFKNYWRKFILVGIVYGLVILIMNIALFGHNVNYYGAIKRSSIFFLTLYGVFVLKEGMDTRQRIIRITVGIIITIAVLLMTLGG